MIKKIILFLAFACFTMLINAQLVKKGFKSLEKLEYEKAKETFEKMIQEDSNNVAANFGMAMVLADDKSPLFDIIASWHFIGKVTGHENELIQEDLEILSEYFLNTEVRKTSRPVKKKVEMAGEAVEARLIKFIREENNLEACYRVLSLYPDFKHYDNVVHIRNQFEFRKYENLNTLAAYEEFIQRFPDAAQAPKAHKYCNKLAFEAAKKENTVTAYSTYISKYPNSQFNQQAIKLRNAAAFTNVKKINSLEAYEQFIAAYPDALEIPEAKKQQHQLMYEKAKRIKTLEAFNQFISKYPEGVYYIDIFNLKSSELGMQEFKKLAFDSPDFKWARALDYNQSIDHVSSIVQTPDSGFVVAGSTSKNDTSYSDAWIVKLDKKGNMLWNKIIGQQFNEKVETVLVNSIGEIIVTGYTQVLSDSSAYLGWMFKLGADGNKIWNKNLGPITLYSSAIGKNDKLYLATSPIADTAPKLSLMAYNTEGDIVWEKDYVQPGTFKTIIFNESNSVFLAGGKWFTLSDDKFYIKWEDTLNYNAKISAAALNEAGIAIASSNTINNYLEFRGLSGNKLWHKALAKTDSTDVITDLCIGSKNEIIISGRDAQSSYLIKFDTKGEKTGEKRFYASKYVPIEMLRTTQGLVYLFDAEDFMLTAFSSSGF